MSRTVTVQDVYKKLERIEKRMVTKEQLESILETSEIMSNPRTMKRIQESEEDTMVGKVKRVRNVKEMLKELDA